MPLDLPLSSKYMGFGNNLIINILVPLCNNIWYYLSHSIHVILDRCISAVIAGSEFVRLERENQHQHSLNNGHANGGMDPELSNHMSAEASINSTLQLFVKLSAEMILDSWSETHRYQYTSLLESYLYL
jgi:hypothetical protein